MAFLWYGVLCSGAVGQWCSGAVGQMRPSGKVAKL